MLSVPLGVVSTPVAAVCVTVDPASDISPPRVEEVFIVVSVPTLLGPVVSSPGGCALGVSVAVPSVPELSVKSLALPEVSVPGLTAVLLIVDPASEIFPSPGVDPVTPGVVVPGVPLTPVFVKELSV